MSRPAPASRLCDRCHVKWSQSKAGLCRRCERELGDTRDCHDRDREAVARQHAAIPAVPADQPRASRTVIVAGVTYEVTWDGS